MKFQKSLAVCLFFLLFLKPCLSLDWVYQESEIECLESDYNRFGAKNYEKIEENLDKLNLSLPDAVCLIVMGALGFSFSLLLIMTFIKYPLFRKPPGGILFAVSIIEFFISISSVISGSYYFIYNQPPKNKSLYCQVTANISISLLIT